DHASQTDKREGESRCLCAFCRGARPDRLSRSAFSRAATPAASARGSRRLTRVASRLAKPKMMKIVALVAVLHGPPFGNWIGADKIKHFLISGMVQGVSCAERRTDGVGQPAS